MAEEKKTPAKVEEGKLTKVLNWFKKLPGRIAKPFKNMVAELKKVTWPSKKRWLSSSIMVLVFMLFMGVVIGLLDLGATTVVRGLISETEVTEESTTTDATADDTVVTDESVETEDAADTTDEVAEDAADETVEETDPEAGETEGQAE